MLMDNPKYGWRFFSTCGCSRSATFVSVGAQNRQATVRIFCFRRNSAAMGDPEPAYGFARQLERLLQARHPGQKIEVVTTPAMTAINSHVNFGKSRATCESREGGFLAGVRRQTTK